MASGPPRLSASPACRADSRHFSLSLFCSKLLPIWHIFSMPPGYDFALDLIFKKCQTKVPCSTRYGQRREREIYSVSRDSTTGIPTTGYLRLWANPGENVNPCCQENRDFKWESREMWENRRITLHTMCFLEARKTSSNVPFSSESLQEMHNWFKFLWLFSSYNYLNLLVIFYVVGTLEVRNLRLTMTNPSSQSPRVAMSGGKCLVNMQKS